MASLATIHNLAEPAIWTSGGNHASPVLDWSFSDAESPTQSAFQIKVYSASTGGTLLYDSGVIVSGATVFNVPWQGVLGTEYWWTINVRDAHGEWSGESSRTSFKMRWGQAIYQYQLPNLGSSGWQWAQASITGGYGAFLFRTASGANGAGATGWKTNLGAVTRIASPATEEWLNVLVRMAPNAAGSATALSDMTFSFISSGLHPDRWEFTGPETDWRLDDYNRRFGSRSIRMTATTAAQKSAYQDVSVSPTTRYTVSCFVKTDGPLAGAVGLVIEQPADGVELIDLYEDTTRQATIDSGDENEGWMRLSLRFRTEEQTSVRVRVRADAQAIGDQFWLDAMQLEEAIMPTPWRPGLVGQAAVVDVGGVIIDGAAGGVFRLRGTAGGAADFVQLGEHGLEFGSGEGWIEPTLYNNWVNYGGSYQNAGYFKDAMGFVHLKGLVKNATSDGNTAGLWILPVGYRPPGATDKHYHFPVISNEAIAYVRVNPNGVVDAKRNALAVAWLSLDGITFYAGW